MGGIPAPVSWAGAAFTADLACARMRCLILSNVDRGGRTSHVTATPRAIELTEIAALAAAEKLANDIVAYDVSDQLAIADSFLLCSGANDRQVRSIIDEVEARLKQAGATLVRREGEHEGRWVLLDYNDLVIHVQNADERVFYALERIWKDCPVIPLPAAALAGRPAGAGRPVLSTARRLVLWRHGQTTWNVEHRFQGQTDIPLNEVGVAQAQDAALRLAALRPAALFSSDLTRAQQTTAPLARLTGLPVTLDKDLRERFGGDWEGLADAEIRERYPAERVTWNPPNGEPTAVVADRVAGAVTRIADGLDDGQLAVVVGHGAALRLGMERLLGLPAEGIPILGSLINCSWSVLERRDNRWRLLEYNVVTFPAEPPVTGERPASAGTLPEPVTGDDQ